RHCQLFGCCWMIVSVNSTCNIQEVIPYKLGVRHMSLSPWNDGSDPDQVTGLHRDDWLVGQRKIPALQWAKLPRYWREGACEVRPFTAKKRLWISEAQGLSNEAMKRNPMTTV